MAVFSEPVTAVRAAIAAREAVKAVEVDGYTPRMRVGIHTGRPQRIGSDWLGVDVNIAARVMERATKGELVVSAPTLERIADEDFESLGVTAKRLRRQVFTAKQDGVPADLAMYRLKTRRQVPAVKMTMGAQPAHSGSGAARVLAPLARGRATMAYAVIVTGVAVALVHARPEGGRPGDPPGQHQSAQPQPWAFRDAAGECVRRSTPGRSMCGCPGWSAFSG